MEALECTRCGSRELREDAGYLVCVYCQSSYLPHANDLPPRRTTIGLAADIQALLRKCRDDPANKRRYANLILDIDPTNQEANRYLR